MDRGGDHAEKKPYEPPALVIYGTVTDLTKNLGHRGNKDGGKAPTIRTAL
ncbi:MAG: lasso RiPP family leader peptide-containing protein [Acidobacteriota bacterium]|nr:lasso RiPP family leader peptide-containing protein [Acidobacteriota bacterium]MDE3169522.1 lasso RiPP family leader peptide-containing protein [Acidobacteriota bacterium]